MQLVVCLVSLLVCQLVEILKIFESGNCRFSSLLPRHSVSPVRCQLAALHLQTSVATFIICFFLFSFLFGTQKFTLNHICSLPKYSPLIRRVKPTVRTVIVWPEGADSAFQQHFENTDQNLPLRRPLTPTQTLTYMPSLFWTI